MPSNVLPKIIIRAQTSEEEFEYLWYVLNRVPFYRKNNYNFEVPHQPEFQHLVNISPNFDLVDKKSIKDLFIKNIYQPSVFENGLKELESERPNIEKCLPTLINFHNLWDFKIFPKYEITLTLYGPGGSYNGETGKIIIKTRKDGTFERHCQACTIIHEIVHIGIEQNIVKKYNLDHWEKERLVDLICSLCFKKYLPEYTMQQNESVKIDFYIRIDTLNNLPSAVEDYINKYPRKTY